MLFEVVLWPTFVVVVSGSLVLEDNMSLVTNVFMCVDRTSCFKTFDLTWEIRWVYENVIVLLLIFEVTHVLLYSEVT